MEGPAGFASSVSENRILAFSVFVKQKWLDRQDSNLRMLGPKPSALPLGDGPIKTLYHKPPKPETLYLLCFS